MITFHEFYIQQLTSRISDQESLVTRGNLQNYSEYKAVCGVLEGLKTALLEFEETYEKFYRNESDIDET